MRLPLLLLNMRFSSGRNVLKSPFGLYCRRIFNSVLAENIVCHVKNDFWLTCTELSAIMYEAIRQADGHLDNCCWLPDQGRMLLQLHLHIESCSKAKYQMQGASSLNKENSSETTLHPLRLETHRPDQHVQYIYPLAFLQGSWRI